MIHTPSASAFDPRGYRGGGGRSASRARSRRWLSLTVVPLATVLLAGCGAYQQPRGDGSSELPSGHPGVSSGAGSASGGSAQPSGGSGSAGTNAEGGRADERAAQAAAERAASFGFTEQSVATEDQVARLREDVRLRQTNTTGTRVDPAECKSALTAVDWSPLLAEGSSASRIDVGSASFQGTGTVEVAALKDGGDVSRHAQNVQRLIQDCGELTFTVDGTYSGEGGVSTFSLSSSAPTAQTSESVASALQWTRSPVGGQGTPATAQVLVGQKGEHAVLVSFIGSSKVADEQFTTMAQAMLDAALAEL